MFGMVTVRVLIAGATGVIGHRVVPLLADRGHEVVALSRTGGNAEVERTGVERIAVDALDRPAFADAVRRAEPDVAVNLLTAIPPRIDPRHMDRDFALTNRLRREATGTLVDACLEGGVGFVISEGLAYAYRPSANGLANEEAPLWTDAPRAYRSTVEALAELERQTANAHGLVLRFGHLYGPGTIYGEDGSLIEDVRVRKMPLVGGGTSVFSFIHVDDAANALLAALDRRPRGVLNIVDDDPVPMSEWLPQLAKRIDAPVPRSVPTWVARMVAGSWGAAYMTKLRGADNSRARAALDWRPEYGSWKEALGQFG